MRKPQTVYKIPPECLELKKITNQFLECTKQFNEALRLHQNQQFAESVTLATPLFDFFSRSVVPQLPEKERHFAYQPHIQQLSDDMKLCLGKTVWLLTTLHTQSQQYDLVWKYFIHSLGPCKKMTAWHSPKAQVIVKIITNALNAYVKLYKNKCDLNALLSIHNIAFYMLKDSFPSVIPYFQSLFSDSLIQAKFHQENILFLKERLTPGVPDYTREKMMLNLATSEDALLKQQKEQADEHSAEAIRKQQLDAALRSDAVVVVKQSPYIHRASFLVTIAGRRFTASLPVSLLHWTKEAIHNKNPTLMTYLAQMYHSLVNDAESAKGTRSNGLFVTGKPVEAASRALTTIKFSF